MQLRVWFSSGIEFIETVRMAGLPYLQAIPIWKSPRLPEEPELNALPSPTPVAMVLLEEHKVVLPGEENNYFPFPALPIQSRRKVS